MYPMACSEKTRNSVHTITFPDYPLRMPEESYLQLLCLHHRDDFRTPNVPGVFPSRHAARCDWPCRRLQRPLPDRWPLWHTVLHLDSGQVWQVLGSLHYLRGHRHWRMPTDWRREYWHVHCGTIHNVSAECRIQ